MTLRGRLLAAAVAVTVLVVAVLAAIVIRQRSVLVTQIDDQLSAVAGAAGRSPFSSDDPPPDTTRQQGQPPTGEFHLAIIDADADAGSQVIAVPVSDPDLAPDPEALAELLDRLDGDAVDRVGPVTIDSTSERARARVLVTRIDETRAIVIAQSMAAVDEAQRQLLGAAGAAVLAVVATMGLVLWWVDRLGLRPIGRLTEAAEAVAGGRSDRRVDHPSTTTETGRLAAAFNTMLDARQEAEERQRRFVADASHELRTPLTTLRGYAALHRPGGLTAPEEVDDAMSRIRTEADRMAALVEDLLTLASLDEDRPLERAPVDLSQLLIDVGSDAAAVQPDRVIDTSGVPAGLVVIGDEHLLTQAITAPTSNALRHTPTTAGLAIGATRTPPSVGGPELIAITVTDRGPGIDADHLPRLFDRFYRADRGRAAPIGGRGLGLSIARTVVEAHGGTITAASTAGQGTTITIELPVGQI